ncbi:zona pellucida sperm-binding protein 3-like [Megalops cyprinoides]|uniref:zona pellucida sperm-binding protein 3-like n=1 Tax=Megalops cyprinoides TaxID=118141 RepID=UPI001864DA87|nr:zona pellucida sperm-binding protein 3-like [Megalops cyprinoides]
MQLSHWIFPCLLLWDFRQNHMRSFLVEMVTGEVPCAVAMGTNGKVFTTLMLLLLIHDSVIGNDWTSSVKDRNDRYRIRTLKEEPKPDVNSKNYKHGNYESNRVAIGEDVAAKDAAAVIVECTERTMNVIVKADFYNVGRLISAEELRLGADLSVGSSCRASVFSDSRFIIEANLHECGTTLSMFDDTLVYSNVLVFSPVPISGIIRLNEAIVPVECHYLRRHVVSSNILKPTWMPFTSTTSAVDLLNFSLRLMTDDWLSERSSNLYYLGDTLYVEASVSQASHLPLRLFMNSCVVTLVPDADSDPRYAFIENHGCLTDSKVTGSKAHFMPRTLDNKLQMQMDVFRFHKESRSSIYITCHLKVTAASQDTDSMNKACYYARERWRSVDGKDMVCDCCDSRCSAREEIVTVGPVHVAVHKMRTSV